MTRIAAFGEYVADIRAGAYPQKQHTVGIAGDELAAFLSMLRQPIGKG